MQTEFFKQGSKNTRLTKPDAAKQAGLCIPVNVEKDILLT
jgi:hypothetical protein